MNEKQKRIIKKIVPIGILRRVRTCINQRGIDAFARGENIPYKRDAYPFGINLIGSFRLETGLGQSVRLYAKQIKAAKIPLCCIDFSAIKNIKMPNTEYDSKLTSEFKYSINIWHINMNEMLMAYKKLGESVWDKRYNIAIWLWEMQEFPTEWTAANVRFDEIWSPSEFTARAIRAAVGDKVYNMPYAIEAPTDDRYDREYFNLPSDKFLLLMLFDANSLSERKNPEGVIKAYKKAYDTKDKNVGIVIKINNASKEERAKLKKELEGYQVYFIDKILSRIEVDSLIKCVDVYVSLHRAEGFGLVLSEAMLVGTATIATNYSATTEFQTEDTACLVGYKMVPVKKNVWGHKKTYAWAEPNIDEAAAYMKKLYEDKAYRQKIEDNAKSYVRDKLSLELAAKKIKDRIERLK